MKQVLEEYSRVVNHFIDRFWPNPPSKLVLFKSVLDTPETWLSARLRKVAAREAIDMVLAARNRDGEKAKKPIHNGQRMCLSSTIASLKAPKRAKEFDAWLHLACIGRGIIMDLPIRFHKHYHRWASLGRRLESYVITPDYVQFVFEVETGPKPSSPQKPVGVDTGMKVLATRSDGKRFGERVWELLERIKRCAHGSKGQRRARRALRQYMDECAKELVKDVDGVVVEKLQRLNHRTKVRRRLTKNMRRVLGGWAYRYWLGRLRMTCDQNRVLFRSVPSFNTSIECSACGHTEQGNRISRDRFLCRRCGSGRRCGHRRRQGDPQAVPHRSPRSRLQSQNL